jgi:putative chitinase
MDWLAILKAITPKGKPEILAAMAAGMPAVIVEADLTSDLRIAHFLAQNAHESDGFKTTVEYWGPTSAQKRYEGRTDLGNIRPGDGKRFMGRGVIQLTGRANYATAGNALGVDFVSRPELAAAFPNALRIAGWYWKTRKINSLADADNVDEVTRRVNGGYNGLEDRKRYLARAKVALAKARVGQLAPAKPKTMATSKAGNGSIVVGLAGSVAAGKEAVDTAKQAAETAGSAWGLAADVGPWIVLAVVIIGVAAFLWFDRRKKLEITGV